MADLLSRVQQEIRERVAELQPLVLEYDRLQQAEQALSGSDAAGSGRSPSIAATAVAAKTEPRRSRRSRTQVQRRAPRGANRAAVLGAVSERPGATVGELCAASGIEQNTMYAVLRTLVRAGEIEKQELPSGRPGYRLTDATDTAIPARERPSKQPTARAKATKTKA